MKKLLAIILVLTMVLPMCLAAEAADAKAAAKPFVLSNSDNLGIDSHNFYPKVTFWSSERYITNDSIQIFAPMCGGGETNAELAKNLKGFFADFPEGTRYIRDLSMRAALETLAEDIIFMEKGVALSKEFFTDFLENYHKVGGKLDGIAVDVEIHQCYSYYLTQSAKKDPTVYDKIVQHPMYAEKIRPQLVEYGFKFWSNITEGTPEIYSVDERSGEEYAQSRQIWDVVIRNYLNSCVDEILLNVMTKYYPDALVFDYQARTTYAWQKNMTNKGVVNIGGNYKTAGHLNYFNTYAYSPGAGFFEENNQRVYKKVPAYNAAIYERNAFNQVLWDTIHAKNYKASAPNDKFSVILCWDNYSQEETSYCNTPYFSEVTYHMGMMDPFPIQSYCIEDEILDRDSDPEEVVKILSEQMDELTRVAGFADRKHIPMPYTWNDKYILTGMYAGGRNIWRITPDTITTGVTLEQFKVADAKDPTFSINGQTITFPGGNIIQDTKITKVGTCGYWVETAKDVLPVITYSVNRYEEFPAFMANFEDCQENAAFDITKVQYNDCWEIKKGKKATPKVIDVSGNNVLALNGTYSLKAKTVLGNITAGDSYAKYQAWQVDVTVPANMAADAEIVLLDIYGTKAKALDGGVKIAGGKVYYTQGDTYLEMPDLDVSAGGKFTVKRGMDFSKADALTSDYYVYDASGKLLAQVKDVSINTIELPVQKIGISVANVAGEAVYFDDFKLYAEGLVADLEIYDAKTGIQQTDVEKARDKSTAYRLSWLNGTAYEKIYSIVAAYYNGDKLVEEKVIQEIKMAPGSDYVSTGIVEVKDGQTVKIYARDDSKDEPNDSGKPGANKPGGVDFTSSSSVKKIIVIVLGVVLLAIVVVGVLFLTKMNSAKKPAVKKSKKTDKTK